MTARMIEHGPAAGIRYIIHRVGMAQFDRDGNRIGGGFWHSHGPLSRVRGEWGSRAAATPYRDYRSVTLPNGGEWLAVLVNVPGVTDTGAGDNWGTYLGRVAL